MEITVKELIRELSLSDPELPVYFGGLDFYRVKDRGGVVQIEFNQSVDKDDNGRVIITNHEFNQIRAYNREGASQVFFVHSENREITNDCKFDGILFSIYPKENSPSLGFNFEIIFHSDKIYIKHVTNNDMPEVSGKGIVKAMIKAISVFYKSDVYSSTNTPELKLYESEGIVEDMRNAWKKFNKDLPDVSFLSNEQRYIYKYVC